MKSEMEIDTMTESELLDLSEYKPKQFLGKSPCTALQWLHLWPIGTDSLRDQ